MGPNSIFGLHSIHAWHIFWVVMKPRSKRIKSLYNVFGFMNCISRFAILHYYMYYECTYRNDFKFATASIDIIQL